MLPAIKLDDQLRFNAREVGEVRSDGSLAAKLASRYLPVAQALPESLFCFG